MKQHILKFFTVLLFTIFAIACSNTRQNDEHDHGDMMEDNQTEMIEGEGHIDGDGHKNKDEAIMHDTTSVHMGEGNEHR